MKSMTRLAPLLLVTIACGSVSSTRPQKSEAGTNAGTSDGDASDRGPSKPPKATDSITIRGNLDATAPSLDWNSMSPAMTSNLATSLVVYDSLGKPIQLEIYFGKDDEAKLLGAFGGAWRYHAITDGGNLQNLTPAKPGTPTEIATGILQFDTLGRLVANVPEFQAFNPRNAANPQPLTFDFGTGTASGGSGLDGITQYAGTSVITFISQSGSPYIP